MFFLTYYIIILYGTLYYDILLTYSWHTFDFVNLLYLIAFVLCFLHYDLYYMIIHCYVVQ